MITDVLQFLWNFFPQEKIPKLVQLAPAVVLLAMCLLPRPNDNS